MRVKSLFASALLAGWIACGAAARAEPPDAAASVDAAATTATTTPSTPPGTADGTHGEASLRNWLARNGLIHRVSVRASDLVVNALSFLGVRYRYGGDSARTGFDCSGFVQHVYQVTLGLVLPRNAASQSRVGEKVPESQLRPGDLVFFNTLRRAFSHVGIYIGNGEFIHSPRPGQSVRIESLDAPYWARRFDGARRILGHDSALFAQDDAALPTTSDDSR